MTADKKPAKLTPKQARFVEEYLTDLNATQAAIRAGYSEKTAPVIASQNLKKVNVQAAIQAAQLKLSEKTGITQERVLNELSKIAFADQRRVMKWGAGGVTLLESKDLSDDDAAIVSEVSETTTATGGSLKLKTHDKVGALKLLGEHLGLFKQRMELTGKDGEPIEVSRKMREMTDDELFAIAAGGGTRAADPPPSTD
jgi:phage terminase small subunit